MKNHTHFSKVGFDAPVTWSITTHLGCCFMKNSAQSRHLGSALAGRSIKFHAKADACYHVDGLDVSLSKPASLQCDEEGN